jgi:hypothetical protein
LGVLSLTAELVSRAVGDPLLSQFLEGLRLDSERSLPTLFAFILLLSNASLLGAIWLRARFAGSTWQWHWLVLALVFLLMAYDEAASLHERLIPLMREFVGSSGILHFAWVVPGLAFVAIMGIAYFRFLLAQPRTTGLLMLGAGAVYVGGALGMEMIGGAVMDAQGASVTYALVTNGEELMEKLGQSLFCYALLRTLADEDGLLNMRVRPLAN